MDPTLYTADQVDKNCAISLKFACHQAAEYDIITPCSTKARMRVMLCVAGGTVDPLNAIVSSPLGGILLRLTRSHDFLIC